MNRWDIARDVLKFTEGVVIWEFVKWCQSKKSTLGWFRGAHATSHGVPPRKPHNSLREPRPLFESDLPHEKTERKYEKSWRPGRHP